METEDLRFDSTKIEELKESIGKILKYVRCNPFEYSAAIYGIVGIVTDVGAYIFTNSLETINYLGTHEDVAMFEVELTDEEKIKSKILDEELINMQINKRIKGIRLINEHQEVFHEGVKAYDVRLTRGIIFDMEDGLEVSLEKDVWFSEMIYVQRGRDLLEKFASTKDFEEDWQDSYRGKATRKIVEL